MIDRARLESAFAHTRDELLRRRLPAGYWVGRLSSSALSTATACSALTVGGDPADAPLIREGLAWLRAHQNGDGGWGDTTDSPSNLSTTLLAVSAFALNGMRDPQGDPMLTAAYAYVAARAGTTPAEWVQGVRRVYGKDRTFAVPILMNCALAGLVRWEDIPGLPYELAALPAEWYSKVKLHVVSYALPALIGIGLLLHQKHPSWNPLARLARKVTIPRVMRKLREIQPENGGYLEATPLISFVAMSLFACFPEPPLVAQECRRWLRNEVREDGSWPIDANLAIWVTTNAVTALANGGELDRLDIAQTRDWLFAQQLTAVHPFTNAAPGAWGWSYLPGSVPDADDTPGAIIALRHLLSPGDASEPRLHDSMRRAVRWLLDLQNGDGGWPSFCKGWGQLPFDMSSPDITSHTLRALQMSPVQTDEVRRARERGFAFLARAQRPNGSWVPLWFGNQYEAHFENPVYGTARVCLALAEMGIHSPQAERGLAYLLAVQNADGGWGGAQGLASSVEETALTVTALCAWRSVPATHAAYARGVEYLIRRVEDGSWTQTTPIGLYFSMLWYGEGLYPIAWTVDALGRALTAARETALAVEQGHGIEK